MDKSRVEPTIFFIEKYCFLLNFTLIIFMGNPSLRLSEVLAPSKAVVGVDRPMKAPSMHIQTPY